MADENENVAVDSDMMSEGLAESPIKPKKSKSYFQTFKIYCVGISCLNLYCYGSSYYSKPDGKKGKVSE